MPPSPYAALTNVQFLLAESVQVAQALGEGRTWSELRADAREGRLFGPGRANSQLTIVTALRARFDGLSGEQLGLLATGSLEQRQAVMLALIVRQKRLLGDFLAEVLVPQWQAFARTVNDADVRAFLGRKAEQEPEVAAWSAATVQKTRGNITRFLLDAGLLRPVTAGEYAIVPQYLAPAVRAAVEAIDPRTAALLEGLQ